MFRRFIESKRSHFACMAEGNAALRAFACFSPVTLSENPFARPFSRSTRFVPRFHATPLLSRFFLSFFFFTRISRRGGRTTTPFFVRRISIIVLENFGTCFFLPPANFCLINRILTLIFNNFSFSQKIFKYDKIVKSLVT